MSAGFSHVALKQLNDITERWHVALTRTRLLITVPCSNPTPADRLNDRAEDHVLPLIASISKPLFVEHLDIQLAVRRFRYKARKSTANVHQTHNQRASMNGTREFTAPRRLIGESDGPARKGERSQQLTRAPAS
jgi:hypothetical protein